VKPTNSEPLEWYYFVNKAITTSTTYTKLYL